MKKLLRRLEPERLGIAVAAWFRERIDAGPVFRLLDRKTVPTHRHSWIYVLGGAALFLFALQVASGSLLMLYYQPTEAAAHESVRKIATEVPSGWLVRSVHAWSADLFIAIVALHFAVKLFSRAYRKPRELTWITGMLLLAVALAAGFSGYLLPWTELSYYATLVGTQIPGTVPVVGDWIVHFLRGGDQVTGDTITRFYAVHVMFLPLLTGVVILGHVALIQMQGISLPISISALEVRDRRPFFTEWNQTRVVLPVHVSDAETRAGIMGGVPVRGRRTVSPAAAAGGPQSEPRRKVPWPDLLVPAPAGLRPRVRGPRPAGTGRRVTSAHGIRPRNSAGRCPRFAGIAVGRDRLSQLRLAAACRNQHAISPNVHPPSGRIAGRATGSLNVQYRLTLRNSQAPIARQTRFPNHTQ